MTIPRSGVDTSNRAQKHVIGIVGGLGPFAHIELERRLLQTLGVVERDQSYPTWLVSSVPVTPSLAGALLHGGPSPVPALQKSLECLYPASDFALMACNTAHAFFDELERRSPLPLVHLIEEVVAQIVEIASENARVGVLGVTALLESQLYPRIAEQLAPGLDWITLRDLDSRQDLHELLTMRPIYGPLLDDGRRARGGIKDGSECDQETGRPHRDALSEAIGRLGKAGAHCVVAGCTEISVAFGDDMPAGTLLVDPLQVAAEAALAIAYGERELPRRRTTALASHGKGA